jgi:ParB-like chromosome segregation protein Spo0J
VARILGSHPLAKLFPDLPPGEFAALVEDIRQNGVKVPILVCQGLILDGRQRYRACQKLKIPCPRVVWNGRDPWLEVQSRNLVRRHLAKDQVYAICKLAADRFPEIAGPIQAAKAEAKQRQTRKPRLQGSPKPLLRSQDRHKESADLIGAQFGVSGSTVKRVDRLAREAPELVPKVAAGVLSVKQAPVQVALKNQQPLAAVDAYREFDLDKETWRLAQTIRRSWQNCPRQSRARFLTTFHALLRELVVEYNEAKAPRQTNEGALDSRPTAQAS